jgi:predicted SnoaL-like aldol condensation-catalyzing enzyme
VLGRGFSVKPAIDVWIGQHKKLFKGGKASLIHFRDAVLREAPKNKVEFFRASVGGAIKRALAPEFKPIHEKALWIAR